MKQYEAYSQDKKILEILAEDINSAYHQVRQLLGDSMFKRSITRISEMIV
jgi:hypothetical protein